MAVIRIGFVATGAADKKTMEGSSNDMDTSKKVLGKGSRSEEGNMKTGTVANGNVEKRSRSAALDREVVNLAVD